VVVGPDVDGGIISFTHGTENLRETTPMLPEGPKPHCLIYAERILQSHGVATLWLQGCDSDFRVEASKGIDYSLLNASEPVVWQNGEVDRRCILQSVDSTLQDLNRSMQNLPPWQNGIRIWQDADVELDEVLCFGFISTGATLATRRVEFRLADAGTDGAGIAVCTQGEACLVNLTGLHVGRSDRIITTRNCTWFACAANMYADYELATDENNTIYVPAADLMYHDTGAWYTCRCFDVLQEAQAVLKVDLQGPFRDNFWACVLGWPGCHGRLTSSGDKALQHVRVLQSCPKLGMNATSDFRDLGVTARYNSSTDLFDLVDVQTVTKTDPGLYELCWCQENPDTGRNCSDVFEFIVVAGRLQVNGPYRLAEQTFDVNTALKVSLKGTELTSQDVLWLSEFPDCEGGRRMHTDSGYIFRMDAAENSVSGEQTVCWCRPGDQSSCTDKEHFQEIGKIIVKCVGDFVNFQGKCVMCHFPWDVPRADGEECEIDGLRAAGLTVMSIFLTISFVLALFQVEVSKAPPFFSMRRIHIEDVSVEGQDERLVMQSLGPHHLWVGASFDVKLHGTNHFLLDGKTRRATVLDRFRLELTDESGRFFVADASLGHFTLSPWGTFWYGQILYCIPLLAMVIFPFAAGAGISQVAQTRMAMSTTIVASEFVLAILICGISKSRTRLSSLSLRVRQYNAMLDEQNPNPSACPRGGSRAVTALRLFELYDFFEASIKSRSMYYIDPNIVRPVTKRHRLSFAERVGPQQVHYFISHWWGTPFRDFCSSVRRHAIRMAGTDEEETWKAIAYWICTFSNNQYRIEEELGATHQQSSFYLALHSGVCKGTAMIMDENASLLKRSWCLFELLQTVRLEREQPGFHLWFCTPTGVLNYGHATVELAMNIGRIIKDLSLEQATATSQADKDMIEKLVLEEMGSFRNIDQILRDHLAEALRKCQTEVNSNFEGLFTDLRGKNEVILEMADMAEGTLTKI
ncbi:unnamed protein product, partial [Effrenium voratum]